MNTDCVTVSNVNRYLNNIMKLDDNLNDISVRGEVSNAKCYPSGHTYFTLKDSSSELRSVLFKGYAQYLDIDLVDGMNVIVNGSVEVYETRGQYQLIAHSIVKDGVGDLHIAFEKLKRKLEEEGLFDESHKKMIPRYPKRIGVVTASSGAAVRDIITTIKRRYPLCEVLVFSTLVQGESAKYEIVEQIQNAQNYDLDTLIVGRGGGSIEDLWSFNEEIVVRAIYDCSIPVISAVGHEIDYTISDYVADLRAPTPTAAAELAVPNITEIKYKLSQYTGRLNNSMEDRITRNRLKLTEISNKSIFKNPRNIYHIKSMDLDNLVGKFEFLSKNIIIENRNKLFKLENSVVLKNPDKIIKDKKESYLRSIGKLEVLNPLLTLKRGYTITKLEDKVVSSVSDVKEDDEIEVEFNDGKINAKVI